MRQKPMDVHGVALGVVVINRGEVSIALVRSALGKTPGFLVVDSS